MKIYIAGSISEDPEFMQKFARAEGILLALGYQVFNPARIAADQGLTRTDPWELCMAVVTEYLYQADILCLLPDWEASTGTRLERLSAKQRHITVIKFKVFEKKFLRIFADAIPHNIDFTGCYSGQIRNADAIPQPGECYFTKNHGCHSMCKQTGECYFAKQDGCYSIGNFTLSGKCYFTVSKN